MFDWRLGIFGAAVGSLLLFIEELMSWLFDIGTGGLAYDCIGFIGSAAGMFEILFVSFGMRAIAGSSVNFGGGLKDSFSSSS